MLWRVCGCRSLPRRGSLAPFLTSLPLCHCHVGEEVRLARLCSDHSATATMLALFLFSCNETRQSHKRGSRRGSLQLLKHGGGGCWWSMGESACSPIRNAMERHKIANMCYL